MSSLTEILLLIFTPGLVSSAIFLLAGWFVVYSFVDHMEIFFLTSGRPYTIPEAVATITFLIIAIASILICPLTAYYNRNIILQYTGSGALQVTLFALTASSQIIILSTACYSVVLRKKYRAKASARKRAKERAPFLEFQYLLKEVDIKVAIVNAKILRDENNFVITDFTLGIDNIPAFAKSFTINWDAEETDGFDVRSFSVSDQITKGGMIRATKDNDGWVFREDTLDAVVSKDIRAIPVQLAHVRNTVATSQLPTAVPVVIHLVQEISTSHAEYHRVFSHLVPLIYELEPGLRKS